MTASISLSSSSPGKQPQGDNTKYGVTMKEWSRGGGTEEAETEPRTIYSDTFTKSLHVAISESTPDTLPVLTTQPIRSREAPASLSTTTHLTPQPNAASTALLNALLMNLNRSDPLYGHHTTSGTLKKKDVYSLPLRTLGSRPATSNYPTATTLPVNTVATHTIRPYPVNLTPIFSALCPHCAARERLILWKPATQRNFQDSTGSPLDLPDEFVNRIQRVLTNGYAESTLKTYASGRLSFHVFCDSRNIPEAQRAPCSSDLLNAWISTMAGHYAGTSVKNYVHGVRAWHIIHGIEWKTNKDSLDTMIHGAERLQPERSRRKKRMPFTQDYIARLLEDFDTSNPFDAACSACLTTSFYCAARVGELTVVNLKDFTPEKYVTTAHVRKATDRNGFETTVLHVPRTKSNQLEGEDLYFSKQLGSTDPESLLQNHLAVNKPNSSEHLFSYQHKAVRRPLTKHAFIQHISKAAKNRGLPVLQGHGIRIGATLEYLLRGVPFDAVRVIGRWKSDAFLLYLRKHAEIMAPYMQPELHQELIRYTMPPVRCECPPPMRVSTVAGCVVHSYAPGITADRAYLFLRISLPLGPEGLRPSPNVHKPSRKTYIYTPISVHTRCTVPVDSNASP
ncbi:DNA breaking-rejoining enzyme [Lentinula edodes]|uniref:DNA breaking-rejoining enzyme n=1 Tax=Lentinula edodes TaxID=5353 RepID=UPI001E8CAC8E|nr:DNA breaking-rejoining enzyme [Lentinula edodes]KAH7873512.1 DNA breaking-rejoining enzyme [Lentinula edodes]